MDGWSLVPDGYLPYDAGDAVALDEQLRSESAISVSRTWHSVDGSVQRTGAGAARTSEW